MTQDEFNNLKVGDKVELLPISLNSIGDIRTILRKTSKTITLNDSKNKSGSTRVDNPVRLKLVSNE